MIKNYYDAIARLGLSEGASEEEVKQAFRALSKKYHPDLYKGDQGESFKEINQAYQYLRRYKSPPQQTIYHQAASYSSHSKSANYQYRNPKSKPKSNNQKERYILVDKIFKLIHPVILFALLFNLLLAIDYILPPVQYKSRLTNIENPYNKKNGENKDYYLLGFENDMQLKIYHEREGMIREGLLYTFEISRIFRKQIRLVEESSKDEISIGFNVLRVFSFFILIQAVALWRYMVVKDREIKMNAMVVILFFLCLQVIILIIR